MHAGSARDVPLVLGGVRSGKSRYALQLAARAQRVTFLATAERLEDEEMQRKIERHRTERPQHWMTIEEPLKLAVAIGSARNCDLLLIDCLTLFAGKMLDVFEDDSAAISESIAALCAVLKAPPCSVVLVSNEVGSGVVPAFELGRRYRDLLGEIGRAFGLSPITVPEFREIGFGEWEEFSWAEIESRDQDYARRWSEAYPNLQAPGGEPLEAFQSRVLTEVKHLLDLSSQRCAVVVTHAGVMRVVLRSLCGLGGQETWERTSAYCWFFRYQPGRLR